MKRIREKLTYANVMSTFAVFLLLGGAAYAAKKITSKDIKKGAVKTKALAKNAVNSKKVKDGSIVAADLGANSVDSSKIADGSVAPADQVPLEDLHVLGTAGNPPLGNGGQGDCTWLDFATQIPGLVPAGFRRDRDGIVTLSGVVASQQNAGVGDEECGATAPEPDDLFEDATVFTLPPAYRPAGLIVRLVGSSGDGVIIGGDQPTVTPTTVIPAGVVIVQTPPGQGIPIDGIEFPAADTGIVPARAGADREDAGELDIAGLEALGF